MQIDDITIMKDVLSLSDITLEEALTMRVAQLEYKRVRITTPIPLKVLKQYKGDFKPRLSNDGSLMDYRNSHLPYCLGNFLVSKVDVDDYDNSLVVGFFDACTMYRNKEKVDLSWLHLSDLIKGGVPLGLTYYEHDKICGRAKEASLQELGISYPSDYYKFAGFEGHTIAEAWPWIKNRHFRKTINGKPINFYIREDV